MGSNTTIAALATPQGASALAVIRISGPQAIDIVKQCIEKKEKFSYAPPRQIGLYRFIAGEKGETVDHISAIKYCAPRSYTGEDMVEIFCHGSMMIVEKILSSLIDKGAQYALPGEFSKRAFLAGKMSLVRAEAITQMIESVSEASHRIAVACYFGSYEPYLNHWKERIERILAAIEAEIEFSEEHIDGENERKKKIKEEVVHIRKEIEEQIEKRKEIKQREHGIQMCFAGVPNTGKSTIMNLVLGYERSIVFHEEGTTRDAVSEQVKWQGVDVRFIDCAGLRDTEKEVERIGIQRSWGYIEKSDIVVLVVAADQGIRKEEIEVIKRKKQKGIIAGIVNKTDLEGGNEKCELFNKENIPYIKCSAIKKEERNTIIDFLKGIISEKKPYQIQKTIICNQRQENVLKKICIELEEMEKTVDIGEEIMAVHAYNILDYLDEYVGKSNKEEIINKIFSEFCIGK